MAPVPNPIPSPNKEKKEVPAMEDGANQPPGSEEEDGLLTTRWRPKRSNQPWSVPRTATKGRRQGGEPRGGPMQKGKARAPPRRGEEESYRRANPVQIDEPTSPPPPPPPVLHLLHPLLGSYYKYHHRDAAALCPPRSFDPAAGEGSPPSQARQATRRKVTASMC